MEQGTFTLTKSKLPLLLFMLLFCFLLFICSTTTTWCCFSDGSLGKVVRLSHVLAASFAGLIAAAAASRYRKQESTVVTDEKIIPQVDKTESGRLEKIEKFSHYVGM